MKKIAADNNYRILKQANLSNPTVWVVSWDVEYEGNMIERIYSSEEKARRIAEEKNKENSIGRQSYSVESYIVDDPEE